MWKPLDAQTAKLVTVALGEELTTRLRRAGDPAAAVALLATVSPESWFHPFVIPWVQPLLQDLRQQAGIDVAGFVGIIADVALPDDLILPQGFGTVVIPATVCHWLRDAGITVTVLREYPGMVLHRCPLPLDMAAMTGDPDMMTTLIQRGAGTWPMWQEPIVAETYVDWLRARYDEVPAHLRYDHRAMMLTPIFALSWMCHALPDRTISLLHGLVTYATNGHILTFHGRLSLREHAPHVLLMHGRVVLEADWLSETLASLGVAVDRMPFMDFPRWEQRLLADLQIPAKREGNAWIITHPAAITWLAHVRPPTTKVAI